MAASRTQILTLLSIYVIIGFMANDVCGDCTRPVFNNSYGILIHPDKDNYVWFDRIYINCTLGHERYALPEYSYCQQHGNWAQDDPTYGLCLKAQCDVNELVDSDIDVTNSSAGGLPLTTVDNQESAYFSCATLGQFNGATSGTCYNGTFNYDGAVPGCLAHCPFVAEDLGVGVSYTIAPEKPVYNDTTTNTLYYISGATLGFTCDDGYVNLNCDAETCKSVCQDGLWVPDDFPECREIDECSSDPCQNNATCTDLVNDFNCSCAPGYEGDLCDQVIATSAMTTVVMTKDSTKSPRSTSEPALTTDDLDVTTAELTTVMPLSTTMITDQTTIAVTTSKAVTTDRMTTSVETTLPSTTLTTSTDSSRTSPGSTSELILTTDDQDVTTAELTTATALSTTMMTDQTTIAVTTSKAVTTDRMTTSVETTLSSTTLTTSTDSSTTSVITTEMVVTTDTPAAETTATPVATTVTPGMTTISVGTTAPTVPASTTKSDSTTTFVSTTSLSETTESKETTATSTRSPTEPKRTEKPLTTPLPCGGECLPTQECNAMNQCDCRPDYYEDEGDSKNPCKEPTSIDVTMTMTKVNDTNAVYKEEYADPESKEFKALERDVCKPFNEIYSNNTDYKGCRVIEFTNGSIIVNYALTFVQNSTSVSDVNKTVYEELQTPNGSFSGELEFDDSSLIVAPFDECDKQLDDCDQNATCTDKGGNGYTCQCNEKFEDVGIPNLLPGRRCMEPTEPPPTDALTTEMVGEPGMEVWKVVVGVTVPIVSILTITIVGLVCWQYRRLDRTSPTSSSAKQWTKPYQGDIRDSYRDVTRPGSMMIMNNDGTVQEVVLPWRHDSPEGEFIFAPESDSNGHQMLPMIDYPSDNGPSSYDNDPLGNIVSSYDNYTYQNHDSRNTTEIDRYF